MRRWDTESTICAIASGEVAPRPETERQHRSIPLRGIIRVAGPQAIPIAFSLEPHSRSQAPTLGKSPTLSTRIASTVKLDSLGELPCDFWVWPNPLSYVGQPTVELHLIGCRPVLEELLSQLCRKGARLAEPGEFTMRAFLAGRMDLAQCEAVLGVIDAQTEKGLDIALEQLAGGLKSPIASLRQELLFLLADLEAGLDFVDEDIEFVSREQLMHRLQAALHGLQPLLEQMENRTPAGPLPSVAFFGPTNSGKSSLVNALSGEQTSIVSHQPGTTRDYLTVPSKHFPMQWVDTAGFEEVGVSGPREIAQRQTLRQWNQADLHVWCIDLSDQRLRPVEQHQRALQALESLVAPVTLWWIGTKKDMAPANHLEEWNQLANAFPNDRWLMTSSLSHQGLQDLQRAIERWLEDRAFESAKVLPTTLKRCYASLSNAKEALHHAMHAAESYGGEELIACELRFALDHLGVVTGEVHTEEILDALFSRFCIGK